MFGPSAWTIGDLGQVAFGRATLVALTGRIVRSMDTVFICIDCGGEHAEPGEAGLGHRVRCLACMIEVELSFELANLPLPQIAA